MEKTWAEAHRREALRRTYELCAELVAEDRIGVAADLREVAWQIAQEEATWRADLGSAFDAARVDREVERVRALAEASPKQRAMIEQARADHERVVRLLAEGRHVRETSERWHARMRDSEGTHTSTAMTEAMARRVALTNNPDIMGAVLRVRVTRIRRATP